MSGGQRIRATADQSIQAGDGGTGFAIDLQGYKRIPLGAELSTFRRLAAEQVIRVADYLSGGHGDAAFADYALQFSLSRRFLAALQCQHG